jgi:hypothetical protein
MGSRILRRPHEVDHTAKMLRNRLHTFMLRRGTPEEVSEIVSEWRVT